MKYKIHLINCLSLFPMQILYFGRADVPISFGSGFRLDLDAPFLPHIQEEASAVYS